MLQRIQSLLLAVVALAMAAFLFLPVWSKVFVDTQEQASLTAFALTHTKGTFSQITPVYYLALLAIFSLILSVYTIFQYKNRVKQMLFVALNSLIGGALMAICVYLAQYQTAPLFNATDKGTFHLGFWAAATGLFCNWAAGRFIRRDDKLVKDADRMR
jgi:glucan phosphoethanolaminetransferase (alkaline phosphatase superfamily)